MGFRARKGGRTVALALLFALLAHGSAAVRSSALSSTGAQVVPSIRYQIHLAMEGVSRLCLLGCRQYREVHSLIGAHITSVLVVCDDCTTLPAGATGALRIGQGHKVEVACSLPSDAVCGAMVIDSEGDSMIPTFMDLLAPLAQRPETLMLVNWHKRHLAVLSGLKATLDVSLFSEGGSMEGDQVRRVFSDIYRKNTWGGEGGGSGGGSTMEKTATIRSALPALIAKYNISSILDSPCGSLFWMPSVLTTLPKHIRYTGIDVACHLIHQHTITFASQPWSFFCADVCHQRLPKADLVFSRDAMQHLPLAFVSGFLRQVKMSGSKWLLIGSYIKGGTGAVNRNISVGDYYPVDVTKPPFNVRPAPVEVVDEKTIGEDPKYMLLFDVSSMEWDEVL